MTVVLVTAVARVPSWPRNFHLPCVGAARKERRERGREGGKEGRGREGKEREKEKRKEFLNLTFFHHFQNKHLMQATGLLTFLTGLLLDPLPPLLPTGARTVLKCKSDHFLSAYNSSGFLSHVE